MLFGQPELDDLLAEPRLRQLRDRVIHRFDLERLHADEISAYIDHRLRAAGWTSSRLFSPQALAQLVKVSDGRARRINLLSDKALLAAYAQGKDAVDEHHVNSAARELPTGRLGTTRNQRQPWRNPIWQMVAASLTAASLSGLLVWASVKTSWGGTAAATAEKMQPAGSPTLHFDASLTLRPRKTN
jgi:hypothetical protein